MLIVDQTVGGDQDPTTGLLGPIPFNYQVCVWSEIHDGTGAESHSRPSPSLVVGDSHSAIEHHCTVQCKDPSDVVVGDVRVVNAL